MHFHILTAGVVACCIGAASAAPAVYPAPGPAKGSGTLPAAAARVSYKGALQSSAGPIVRDLGFTGVVDGVIVWTFGDTLWTVDAAANKYTFCCNDSVAVGDVNDIAVVHDIGVDQDHMPQQWIPLTKAEEASGGGARWAEGGTNVVEYAPGKGLVWFLQNDRKTGVDDIVGGGVATVHIDAAGKPVATRTMEHLWGKGEPFWGDIGVTFDPQEGNVYVYGNGANSSVYLARVKADHAMEIDAYEYWDNEARTWGKQRFGDGTNGTRAYTDKQAVWGWKQHGQSNPFWSNHYNCWMTVYGAQWPTSPILVRTADKLEGPWSDEMKLAETQDPHGNAGGLRYAICPHPEYDPTGKTLMVTWTDNNVDQIAVIDWK